jgi:hypothetical protein
MHKEELSNLYFSPNNLGVIKSKRKREDRSKAHTIDETGVINFKQNMSRKA